MAVLGQGGRLWLRRDAPEALVLGVDAVHLLSNTLLVKDQGYWSGDEVTLTSARGLPLLADEAIPACPDGFSAYAGSTWQVGPNRSHIADDSDTFYTLDSAPFYVTESVCGLQTTASYFIYRDQLDRISFYTTQAAALRGQKQDRVQLYKVDFGNLILAPIGTEDYQNALLECSGEIDLGDYNFSDIQDEATLQSLCAFAPDYEGIEAGTGDYANAAVEPLYAIDKPADKGLWTLQTQLSGWVLNLTASEIDTTAVGEKFGDAVKSLVTGGGTVDFLIAREDCSNSESRQAVDSTSLLRLLLLTEKGCKADCQFWMIEDQRDSLDLLPGDLFYETKLLVTNAAINTQASDLIAGTINFVTVGRVDLKMGSN